MKKRIKQLLACVSLLLPVIFPVQHTWSCGPSIEPDEVRFMLYNPSLSEMDNLSALYYNERYVGTFLSGGDEDNRRNCREWARFTKGAATTKDINAAQYDLTPNDYATYNKTNNWSKLKNNTFISWLQKPAAKKAKDYFSYAKTVEFAMYGGETDQWEDRRRSVLQFDSLAKAGLAHCQEKNMPEFLKQRYAFQAVKMTYYDNTYNKDSITTSGAATIQKIYEKYLSGRHTVVADWGMLYYALTIKKPMKRTRALVHTFGRSEEKKGYVFQFIYEDWLKQLRTQTTNTQDLLLINTLLGLKNPGRALPELKAVCSVDPQNRFVPLLISREVNKLEDWILSPEVTGFHSTLRQAVFNEQRTGEADYYSDTSYRYFAGKNLAKDKAYMVQVRDYLITLLPQAGKYADMLRLAIAHLYHMDHQFAAAKPYLEQIKNAAQPQIKQQIAVERCISLIYSGTIATPATQEKLYRQFTLLKALDIHFATENTDYFDRKMPDNMGSELLLMLAKAYKDAGHITLATLVHHKAQLPTNHYMGYYEEKADNYTMINGLDQLGKPADADTFFAFKHKRSKTAFEQFISPNLWPSDDFLRDAKATLLLRQDKWEDALAVLQRVDNRFWETHYAYKNFLPQKSITTVGTLLPCDTKPQSKYPYHSKKLILQEMVAAKQGLANAKTDSARAMYAFQLANIYYNISWYGKGWMMYSYGHSTSEGYYSYNVNFDGFGYSFAGFAPDRQTRDYYTCRRAIAMYQQAMAYAKGNKELSARCLVMLAYCDKQRHYANRWIKNSHRYILGDNEDETYKSPFIKTIARRYANTNTYRVCKTACPDI